MQRWVRYKIKIPRYRYSVMVLKSTSVPVLGTFFKKYRGTGTVLCKMYSNNHWRSQKFCLGELKFEKNCDIILVAFFGDAMVMFEIRFHNNQLKKSQFDQITKLYVTKLKVRGRWGRKALALGNFLKVCY